MTDIQTLEAVAATAVQYDGTNHTDLTDLLPAPTNLTDRTQGCDTIMLGDKAVRIDPGDWLVVLTDAGDPAVVDYVVVSNEVYLTYFEDA